MMEAKQRAIQAAYGDAWEKVKHFVDQHNGHCSYIRPHRPEDVGFVGEYDVFKLTKIWWPKSLSGIEDNNEWVRCDERLPDKLGDYYVCINGEFDGQILHTNEIRQMFERFPDHSKPSHWQPVILPKPPLY